MLNLEGKKFYRLTVLKKSYSKHGRVCWNCICECGNKCKTIGSLLVRGSVKSCGCLRKENGHKTGKSNIIPRGSELWELIPKKELYRAYKKNAKKRKIKFNLSFQDFISMTRKKCYYCDSEPKSMLKYWRDKTNIYIYNGIDRIDNNNGYVNDNVVTCCNDCNLAKRALSETQFITLISKIYKNYLRKNR